MVDDNNNNNKKVNLQMSFLMILPRNMYPRLHNKSSTKTSFFSFLEMKCHNL